MLKLNDKKKFLTNEGEKNVLDQNLAGSTVQSLSLVWASEPRETCAKEENCGIMRAVPSSLVWLGTETTL